MADIKISWICPVCRKTRLVWKSNTRKAYFTGRCDWCNRSFRGKATRKHGLHRTRAYKSWDSMIRRCTNPKHDKFQYYGGRGITVCERWLNVETFYADMGDPPPGTTLDRINVNGPYSPENCRWATWIEQQNNRHSNRLLTYKGETATLAQMAAKYGVNARAIWKRLRRGWTTERALTTPISQG